jgi:hypothetical protein
MLTGLATLLLSSALIADPAIALQQVDGLRLRDQHGAEDSLAAHRGRVVVVMVVDAKRLRTLKAWERDLRERFEEIDYLRIAALPDDPPPTYERVAARLAEQVPDGVSVLIDLEGRWAAALELDTGRPNVLLVDSAGRLRAAFAGRHEPAIAAVAAANLERLLSAP